MDDNLEMDYFNLDDNIELNFNPTEFNPDDLEDQDDENNNENNQGEDQEDQNDNNDSESVAEDEDDQDEGDDTNDDSGDSPNLFSSVATVLHEEGVLPSLDIDDLKIENADDLAKAVKSEVDTLYKKTLVDKFGEDGYEYITKGVRPEEVVNYQERGTLLNSITDDKLIEDIELSKNVIYEDYLAKGMSAEKATKLIQRSAELGDDIIVEDAKEALESLKLYNKQQIDNKAAETLKLEKQAEKQRVEQERKVKSSIYSVEALNNGPSINKSTQDKVYRSMTTIVGNSPTGTPENALMKARREDPIAFDTNLYYVYELTKGFTDFSKFGKASKRKTINDLERAMQANKNDYSGKPSYIDDNNSYDSPFGELNI